MAAIAAMLDQSVSAAQGNLNPGIYQMSISAPTAFHDVTLTSSGVTSCDINTPSLCNNSIPGPSGLTGGQAGYEVGTGYDEATGLGSLNASTFVNAYPTASKIFTPTLALSGDSTVATNEPFWVDVGTSGAPYSVAPTGTFTLTIGSYTSTVAVPSNAYVIFNLAAGTLPIGNYTETATYTPDAASAQIYASASATAPLSVTVPPLVHPTLTVTPSPTIFANSEPITVALVVNPVQYYPNPTGSVTLTSGTYSSGPVLLVNQSATILIPAGSLAVGADTLIVTYTPDSASASSYLTTTWNSASVQNEGATITPAVTPSVSPGNPTTAQSATISVSVDGFPGNPAPTGSVVVTTGPYASPPATLSNGVAKIGVSPGALPVGLDTLTATYTPDTQSAPLYSSASGSNTVGVYLAQIITPTVTLTPVTQNPTISQPLVLAVSVNGGAGAPVATGFVRIGTAAYGTVDAILAGGAAEVTLASGSFGSGAIVVTGQYFPDSQGTYAFNTASGSTTVNVAKITPVLAILPTPPSVSTQDSLQVEVDVNGPSGVPGANGTVSFTCGYYTSGPLSISNSTGSFISVTIPPGQLPLGTNTISANYSGDNNYNAAMGTGTVTVTAPAGAAFTITDSSFVVTKGSGVSNATGVLLTPTNGFVGTVTLSAAITASPAGAQDLPTMTFTPASVNLADFNTATSALTFTTTAATSGETTDPSGPLARWSGVTAPVLACLALWLVPVRRRLWRNLAIFAALAIFIASGLAACGGSGGGTGGGGGGGGGGGNSGTTSGQYTITITGTSGSMTETSTFTLTVQ